jgi:hypothetical protein
MIYQSDLLVEIRRLVVDDYVRLAHMSSSLVEAMIDSNEEKAAMIRREIIVVEDDLRSHLDDLETVARANYSPEAH